METKKSIIFLILFTCICLFIPNRISAQNEWWQTHPLRIYHPNMKEIEAKDFDVKKFIADCKELHAEAVVFSTRAVYAFYDTKINVEQKSTLMGNRDLLAEVINEAEANNIKVIARLDFTNAPRKYFDQNPDWFHLDPGRKPRPSPYDHSDRFYQTNLLGGYQNDDYALPVFKELLSNYNLDGFHLNGAGWRGTEYDESMIKKYNIPTDKEQLKPWREKMFSLQLQRYHSSILQKSNAILFMGETNSIETSGWGYSRGYNPELMAKGFTNILSTSGEPEGNLLFRFRWWVSLTADWLHSANAPGLPIINLKTNNNGSQLTMKPVLEYQFYAFQALAHNAGLKTPTMGLLSNLPDGRTKSTIKEIFQFMEQQEQYMTNVVSVAPVVLIWPSASGILESGEVRNFEDDLRNQMFGLYSTLAHRHILCRLLNSNNISSDKLTGISVLILPGTEFLNNKSVNSLLDFIETGGRLVIIDHPDSKGSFPTLPEKLTGRLGGIWTNEALNSKYGVPREKLMSLADNNLAPVKFEVAFRKVTPDKNAEILLTDSQTPDIDFFPEESVNLEEGNNPILFTQKLGKGEFVYFGGSFGEIIWKEDFPDFQTILEKMIYPDIKSRWLLTDAPSTVNITAYRNHEGFVIHLVNGTGSVPLNGIVPVYNLKISVREKTAKEIRLYSPGKMPENLIFNPTGEMLEINVPRLDAYAQIIII